MQIVTEKTGAFNKNLFELIGLLRHELHSLILIYQTFYLLTK